MGMVLYFLTLANTIPLATGNRFHRYRYGVFTLYPWCYPCLTLGGMNMLFAGDFAQLPPAIGQEHSALYSRTVGNKSTSPRDQEAAIGKALCQQVTTVVILRQNMRQKTQSKEDTAL